MGGGALFFCWDACVLIEHFCHPPVPAADREERLAGIDAVLDRIEAGEAKIIAPVVWRVELLDCTLTPEKRRLLQDFIRQSDEFLSVAVDTRIAEKAHDIRNRIQGLRMEKNIIGQIKGMDCLYPATAIVYRAAELHTFDARLLQLNGDPVLEGLIIKSPKEYTRHFKRL